MTQEKEPRQRKDNKGMNREQMWRTVWDGWCHGGLQKREREIILGAKASYIHFPHS
jgi:hypothetical protein